MPARYAVYYAPSAGDALHQAVTPLLGRDALGGLNVPQATPPGVDPVFWKAVTRVPAHYGLHATLKAPFELRHSGPASFPLQFRPCPSPIWARRKKAFMRSFPRRNALCYPFWSAPV